MLSKQSPILYYVTPEIGDDILGWGKVIKEAVLGGVRMVQIRDKTVSKERILSAAQLLQAYLKQKNVALIINDHVDIAHAVKADGVHLGQADHDVEEARSLLGPQAIIGLSVETLEQAKAAQKKPINYIAASPVFDTNTKKDCAFPWGIEGLKQLCGITLHPVIAIGGINFGNIQDVKKCGVSGIAVVSSISSAKCPHSAVKEMIQLMGKA